MTAYIIVGLTPKDAESLAQAITYLLQNPEMRREMGEAGYSKMRSEFSWDISAEKHIEVYHEVLQQKRGL